jgi:CSLREA domain-containing protein
VPILPRLLVGDDEGRSLLLRACFALVLAPALAASPRPAAAATITVTTTDDEIAADGDCSLREALQAAGGDAAVDACSAGSGADTVLLAAATYLLDVGGTLDLPSDVTLSGAGASATFIDGAQRGRVMTVPPGASVTLSGLTVQNGLLFDFDAGLGGGILSNGTLALSAVVVRGNASDFAGGGIWSDGTLTLGDSTVRDNDAPYGGGIFNLGPLTVTNTTVSGNTATQGDGGGIFSGDAAQLGFVVALRNATIAGNDAGANGGGLAVNQGTVVLSNTLVAGNAAPTGPDCLGTTLGSEGYNLIGATTDCSIAADATNLLDVDPLLGPLDDHGGPTPTRALLAGSPAIDAGNPAAPGGGAACPSADQRGLARPQDGDGDGSARCDIGAFELEATGPPLRGTMTGGGRTTGPSGDVTYRFTLGCDVATGPQRLWVRSGRTRWFVLDAPTSAACADDAAIGARAALAGFDTLRGGGIGRPRGRGASAEWVLVDGGKGGVDVLSIVVKDAQGQVVLEIADAPATHNRAHAPRRRR